MQGRVDVLHIVQDMALRDEQIFPTVVVKIFQAYAPAGASTREHTQAGFETTITERAAAIVVIDTVNFSRQFSHDNVWPSVVVIVLKDHAHARQPPAILRKRGAGLKT